MRTCARAEKFSSFLVYTLSQLQVATLGDLEPLTQSPYQCLTSFWRLPFSMVPPRFWTDKSRPIVVTIMHAFATDESNSLDT